MNFQRSSLAPWHILLFLSCLCQPAVAQEPVLRGELDKLELRIVGRIMGIDGKPADAPQLIASVSRLGRDYVQAIPVVMRGNRFELWLPVHLHEWNQLHLEARSKDGEYLFCETYQRPAIRALGLEELELDLLPCTRTVKIRAIHEEKPVAKALVKVQTTLRSFSRIERQCDADGQVEIKLLPNETVEGIVAWSGKTLVGGRKFGHDTSFKNERSLTVELGPCSNRRIRVVDSRGEPCAGVQLTTVFADGVTDRLFSTTDIAPFVTNELGEAQFEYFPDWDVESKIRVAGHDWALQNQPDFEEPMQLRVHQNEKRLRFAGKLERGEGGTGGFCVTFFGHLGSRYQEYHSATDSEGNFVCDVLPGVTYWFFANDLKQVSEVVETIPAPRDKPMAPPVEIRFGQHRGLSIQVTSGEQRRALANQPVQVSELHEFDVVGSEGLERFLLPRRIEVLTDSRGRATARVASGAEVRVSVHNADWYADESVKIEDGDNNEIKLHRANEKTRNFIGVVLHSSGRALLPEDLSVTAVSLDPELFERARLGVKDDGVFIYATKASEIGVLVTTADGTFAATAVTSTSHRALRMNLIPTVGFKGRLLDDVNGTPITDHEVFGRIGIVGNDRLVDVTRKKTVRTDAMGYFVLDGLPAGGSLSLVAKSFGDGFDHGLETVKLQDGRSEGPKTYTIKVPKNKRK